MSAIFIRSIVVMIVGIVSCSQSTSSGPRQVPRCGRGVAWDCASEGEYQRLADEAVNVKRQWRRGDAEWSETLVDFSDRAYNEHQRLACGASVARKLEVTCNYRVVAVVDCGEGSGEIHYVETRDLAEIRDPLCVEYADCVAAGYVGKIIRMPRDLEGIMALQFFVQALPQSTFGDDLQNPEFLRMDIEITREDYERLSRRDWQSDPRLRFIVPHLAGEVRYFERKLAELEG